MNRNIPRLSEEELSAVTRRMVGKGGVGGGALSATRPAGRTAGNSREPVANPAPSPTNKNAVYAPYKNKLEYTYAQVCEQEKRAGLIKDWTYESMTLKLSVALPGERGDYHRTDFLKWHNDGSIEIAQTKGWHKNLRASLKGLRWAAQKNPWFRFTIYRYRNGWACEVVS